MKFLELVQRRYSCRGYTSRDVEQAKLDYVMECVRLAPSAVNKQPWCFHVVNDARLKEKLWECYHRDWFKTAPLYIVATILRDEQWVRIDGKPHGDIDIAIAVEHLCLAAAEQGLATCWVCNFDVDLCRQVLSLTDREEPAVLVPIGYASDEPKPKHRKAIGEIVK